MEASFAVAPCMPQECSPHRENHGEENMGRGRGWGWLTDRKCQTAKPGRLCDGRNLYLIVGKGPQRFQDIC
jgi:hypothetical protein